MSTGRTLINNEVRKTSAHSAHTNQTLSTLNNLTEMLQLRVKEENGRVVYNNKNCVNQLA